MNDNRFTELIGKEYKCLDKGFVRLLDVMGDDSSIVQAARVSYGKGTKSVSEDRGLIRYLMRHRHTSPFEMVEFKFHVKLPIFVARQWIRHRTANVNEYSGRYSEMKEECYLPETNAIRAQSMTNKQARSDEQIDAEETAKIIGMLGDTQFRLFREYDEMLNKNVAREIARINLPLSTYTEWYWKIDLHNLFHFLKLRLDEHAQYEIRVYAEVMSDIIRQIVPITYEAFDDFVLNSQTFSKSELKALKAMCQGGIPDDTKLEEFGIKGGERTEFKLKMRSFLED
ncbi:MAG: Flavin-dependent thymidylate synthase [Ignavibacteria bacterium]|nr:Flavin-dependent thymidylate synthase [Ignavibacteria bacterium]